MSEEKFFGKSDGVNPEDTLEKVVDQMEEMDEKNRERGGDGTVILENKAGKKRIHLSTEKVPEPRNNEQENC